MKQFWINRYKSHSSPFIPNPSRVPGKNERIEEQQNDSCILFFNGWGMDKNAIAHLDAGNYDICVCYDYSEKIIKEDDFARYKNLYLVAWSLGVYAASIVISSSKLKITKSIAINGTLNPIDDSEGIPEQIFLKTLNGWNEQNRIKFNRRIFGGMSNAENKFLSNRTIENQKKELLFLYDLYKQKNRNNIIWDIICVGENDLIFTKNNQLSYWTDKASILVKDWTHFPFSRLKSWDEIIYIT